MHTVISYIISIVQLWSANTSFATYPLGDSVDLWIVLPSAHCLETPETRKRGREREGERGGGEGGQRCKWIYSSDHRHRENKQFQLKHFLLRWEGEGWRLQRGQTLWTSARLLCFTVWDTASAGHSQAFKIPPSPSNAPLASIKKTHNALHHLSSLSLPLWFSQPVYSHPAWQGTQWGKFDGSSPEFREKVLLYFITEGWTRRRSLVYIKQKNSTMSFQQHVCIYFEWRIIARWKFPCR